MVEGADEEAAVADGVPVLVADLEGTKIAGVAVAVRRAVDVERRATRFLFSCS